MFFPSQALTRFIYGFNLLWVLPHLFAVSIIPKQVRDKLPDFRKRIAWFEKYRRKNNRFWPNEERTDGEKILLSLVQQDRLKRYPGTSAK